MVPQFGVHESDGRKSMFIFNTFQNNNNYKFNMFEVFRYNLHGGLEETRLLFK
jgi:hypothetical protein